MAQTTLIALVDEGNYSGPGVYQRKKVITLADLIGIGAATTGDILLENIPAKCSVTRVFTKHTQAVAGAGPITAATVVIKTANNATLGGAAFDVFQAVSNTASQQVYPAALKENYAAVTPLLAGIVLTGGNASGLTAGNIEVEITYEILP